ncbi:hypothetical protein J6590_019763 [Homalodisca vitripennis]|nr:hypothetical protein J6590_019763 [Homalodisca vitripennis]
MSMNATLKSMMVQSIYGIWLSAIKVYHSESWHSFSFACGVYWITPWRVEGRELLNIYHLFHTVEKVSEFPELQPRVHQIKGRYRPRGVEGGHCTESGRVICPSLISSLFTFTAALAFNVQDLYHQSSVPE